MSFYEKNDIVEMAVKMEQNGYTFYDNALQRNDLDDETRSILTILRDDEKEHEYIFKALRNKIDQTELEQNSNWEEAQFYMESIVKTHVFYEPSNAIQMAKNAENTADLITYAIQFEKDSIIFFFSLKKYVKNHKTEKILDTIINEEFKHIRKLQDLI